MSSACALQRIGAGGGRDGLRDLGLEQFDLLQGRSEVCLVAFDRGQRARIARLGGLRILHAAIAGRGEVGIALVLLLGEGRRRRVDIERRPGRLDNRLLHVELGLLARDRGFCGGDVGLGLIERDLEVAVVDPRQHLAGLHALVVAGQHFVKIAGDLRRDRGVVGLHVGVIGGDQETADRPVVPTVPGCAGQQRDRGSRHQEPPKLAPFRGFCRSRRGGRHRRAAAGTSSWTVSAGTSCLASKAVE